MCCSKHAPWIIAIKILCITLVFIWISLQIFNVYLLNYVDIVEPLKHTLIGLKKQQFDFLIFQIGWNKCGTTSLYHFMQSNNIPSIHNTECKFHFDLSNNYLYLNKFMLDNYRNNRSVLPLECTDYFQFYSDFGTELSGHYNTIKQTVLQKQSVLNNNLYNKWIKTWYKIFTAEFPNSKYILNIRNVNNWLKSKYLHHPSLHKQIRFNDEKNRINQFIDDMNDTKQLQRGHMSDIDILLIYKNSWYLYICNLIKHFKENNILDNLLIFNVESDPIEKLIEFFEKFGIVLDSKYWKQKNKSKKKKWISEQDQIQLNKWINIENEYPEYFSTNYADVKQTEYDRIIEFCREMR
eukprot:457437_1